jgi:uridine phosphorylase
METAHLFHLAQSWPRNVSTFSPSGSAAPIAPPIADPPGHPNITSPPGPSSPPSTSLDAAGGATSGRRGSQIRAAAVHMVFAARQSNAFITPEQVAVAEEWAGRGVVEALVGFKIASEVAISVAAEHV